MNYFDESNKLAKLVLEWWEEHKEDSIHMEGYDCDLYDEEPIFVKQARIVLECE